MKKLYVSLMFAIIGLSNAFAQDQQTFPQNGIEIGLSGAPSISNINTEGKATFYKNIGPINYGVRVIYHLKRFCFSTGLLQLTQGAKFTSEITSAYNPDVVIGTMDVKLRTKGIILPINCDYTILKTNGMLLYAGLGIYNGYIYSQKQITLSETNDIDIVNKYYCGFNADIGFKVKLSEHFNLDFRPNFIYQLRKELPSSKYLWTDRLMSFSLDIGLYYTFKEKSN